MNKFDFREAMEKIVIGTFVLLSLILLFAISFALVTGFSDALKCKKETGFYSCTTHKNKQQKVIIDMNNK